jgi:hypothetical protein
LGEFGGASSLLAEFDAKRRHRAFWMRIPTKPAMHSNPKPATCSDPKPAWVPI